MSDDIDSAADTTALFNDLALKRHRERVQAQGHPVGCEICDDCGEGIALKRLAAVPFCRRCAGCQAAHELKESRYA